VRKRCEFIEAVTTPHGVERRGEMREHFGQRLREVTLGARDAEQPDDRMIGHRETLTYGIRAPVSVDQRSHVHRRQPSAHREREPKVPHHHVRLDFC
jgi:hypothetical protein